MTTEITAFHENRIRALEVSQAVLEERTAVLTKSLDANTQAITELTETLNKGKGAWWVLAAISGTSGTAAAVLTSLFNHGGVT